MQTTITLPRDTRAEVEALEKELYDLNILSTGDDTFIVEDLECSAVVIVPAYGNTNAVMQGLLDEELV